MTINISLTGIDLAAAGKEGVTALVNACAVFAGASIDAESVGAGRCECDGGGVLMVEPPQALDAKTADALKGMSEHFLSKSQEQVTPEHTTDLHPVQAITSVHRNVQLSPMPVPTTPAPVPTAAAPTYTIEELQVACAPLTDANRMGELQAVCAKYGAASLLDIPKEQYGALAADLRALGARL